MWLLARRNLFVHTGRFLLAVAGITSAVVLVVLLMGLYAGWRDNMSAYLRHVDTDLWVGQKSAYDLFHTLSLLPMEEGKNRLEDIDGITHVSAFIGRLMTCLIHKERRHTFVVGVDGASGGSVSDGPVSDGPVAIVKGRTVERTGEIVVDDVFARKENLQLGDTLTISGISLAVVGIARGGNCFLYQYSFVTLEQAQQLFGVKDIVNYFLVRLRADINADKAATLIEQEEPRVSVFTKEQFIANNLALTGDNFLPILRVLEIIGLVVGTVIIGLTIYTLTVERGPEYGVLKAIGAPNRTLYWTASLQAITCGLCGWSLGVPLSWQVVTLARYFVPQFPAAFYPRHAVWMLGCTLAMSLIAALLPARRIARIDPLVAFKG